VNLLGARRGRRTPETPAGPRDSREDSPGHLAWISWARIAAIVGVVTIHVCSHLVFAWGTTSAKLWHFANLLESTSRASVPVFVMVSGAILVAPRPDQPRRAFYRRRAARIGVPLVVWTCFFLVFDAWSNDRAITAYTFVQGFLWGRPYYHLYFLYVLAGLYLVTPFLRAFVAAADRRLLLAAAGGCLGLAVSAKLQHMLMGGGGFNAFTYFLPYVGYYLMGYVIATAAPRWPRRVVTWWSASVFAGTVLVTHVGTWWLFAEVGPQQGRMLYDYFAPPVVVAALAAMWFFRAVVADRWDPASSHGPPSAALPPVLSSTPSSTAGDDGRWVRTCAGLTLGIFVLHPLPLELLVRRQQPTFASAWVDMAFHLGVIVALVVGCGLMTLALRRIPFVRRLV
jgi:surface polysaccharide O-acyltransferase-like enzyme